MHSTDSNRPRPEFLVLRFKVEIMHGSSQVFGCFQLPLNKRFVEQANESHYALCILRWVRAMRQAMRALASSCCCLALTKGA